MHRGNNIFRLNESSLPLVIKSAPRKVIFPGRILMNKYYFAKCRLKGIFPSPYPKMHPNNKYRLKGADSPYS